MVCGRCAGAGAKLADAADQPGRAVRGRRAGRHHRAHPRRAHERDPRPAAHHRECRRRRRHDRLAARRQVAARRLFAAAVGQRRPHHQPDALPAAALQRPDRFRARGAAFRLRAHPDHAAGFSGQDARRIHRLRQGQPGQDAVRLRRRRLRLACLRGAARRRHGHQDHACALSRRRPGDAGPDRRPHRLHGRADLDGAAADPGRQGEGARDVRARPRARPRRSRDRGRAGIEGPRLRLLGLVLVPEGHARRHRAAARAGLQRGGRVADGARPLQGRSAWWCRRRSAGRRTISASSS